MSFGRIKLFGKKKEEKEVVPTSTTSETIWREVNLFIPETIALAGAFIFVVIMLFVLRIMSMNSLELIRSKLSEEAYNEVAGVLMNMNTLFVVVGVIPLLVFGAFWVLRFINFTPRKGKYLTARVMDTGAIRLSVDRIKDGAIKFSQGMMGDTMKINNPKKHLLENTGKPFLFLFEHDDCNADLNIMAGNISGKAKFVNTINENSLALGRRIERYMQEKSDNLFSNPMFWIMLAIAGLVVLSLFFSLKNPETTAELLGKSAPALIGGF